MIDDTPMLKIENVSKEYRLGEIGGTTLRDELQRLKAKIFKREDPTKKIGAKNYNKGEKFKALDNVSFSVTQGERVGIIGHNGAGKSTLLKLISRVTGPTDGKIYLNGRVASMLEVGTGFHGELTGRENVYMNGAILGMTKKEIDQKIDKIIEFSEVSQFIDTPVKRYSSGMYVKLAFSVAAHLDSEIMIMDEVLAVGDMKFQQKCLKKMKEVSLENHRTILYVSHNMNTIRQLCDRVIVLDHGKLIFDGDVEEGIKVYSGVSKINKRENDLTLFKRNYEYATGDVRLQSITLLNDKTSVMLGDKMKIDLSFLCKKNIKNLYMRFTILHLDGNPVGSMFTKPFPVTEDDKPITKHFEIDTSMLIPDCYCLKVVVMEFDDIGRRLNHDYVDDALYFDILPSDSNSMNESEWINKLWGSVYFPTVKILDK